jgi:hypothetical protein
MSEGVLRHAYVREVVRRQQLAVGDRITRAVTETGDATNGATQARRLAGVCDGSPAGSQRSQANSVAETWGTGIAFLGGS